MEIMSQSICNIAKAISEAQRTMGKAHKNSKNPFFKSDYADLEEVSDAANEEDSLSNNELSFTCSTCIQEGTHILIGTLMHSSGEWIRTFVPLLMAKPDMQSYGSCCTYARRYAMASLLNICTRDDDDGEAAMDRVSPVQITMFDTILSELNENGLREKIFNHLQIKDVKFMSKTQFENTMRSLRNKLEDKKPKQVENV